MIEKLFSPEEWAAVWTSTPNGRRYGDPMQEFITEKIQPYVKALAPAVIEGRIDRLTFIYAMTALAMIEEIEVARAMKEIN